MLVPMMMLSNQIPNGELVNKAIERNFKTIVNYMGNPGLRLAPMFLLVPVIRDISGWPTVPMLRESTRSTR